MKKVVRFMEPTVHKNRITIQYRNTYNGNLNCSNVLCPQKIFLGNQNCTCTSISPQKESVYFPKKSLFNQLLRKFCSDPALLVLLAYRVCPFSLDLQHLPIYTSRLPKKCNCLINFSQIERCQISPYGVD